MRLLVLDDERGIVALVATVARERGWDVDTATDETEFRGLFAIARPDAAMVDLQLGSQDGVEQLRYLSEAGFAGAVVLMSGFDTKVLSSASQFGTSLGLTVVEALAKPIRIARLREVLADLEARLEAVPAAPDAAATPAAETVVTADTVRRAIEADEMVLYLQPVVNALTHRPSRLEALIRWRQPDGGIVMPDSFIPIAEQDDATIDALTFWVIETALDHHRLLAARGHDVPISINISGRNLRGLDFPDRVAVLLNRSGLPPSSLVLEITESVAVADPGRILSILSRLRLKGFELAMDDFGTGYSSLKALQQMPFSELKIDKSFVVGFPGSPESMSIVNSVVTLARNLNLTCVAEGVETPEAATMLGRLGAGWLQGYHFGRAMPIDDAIAWLDARAALPDNGSCNIL